MEQLTHTLKTFLTERVRSITADSDTHEYRIFLGSFPPEVIYQAGRHVEDFLKGSGRKVEFVFRIGRHLWDDWRKHDDNGARPVLKEIEKLEWVDSENRLTYFRNMKLPSGTDKDALVVILAGVDRATDSASLEDFYQVDAQTLWTEALGKDFRPWLKRIMARFQIEAEDADLEKMDELLQILHHNFAGDLLKISEFLDYVNFSGAMSGEDALRTLYGSLDFWGLPPLKSMSQRKWSAYVPKAIDFFRYKPFLKESGRKQAFKKINTFKEKIELDEQKKVLNLSGEFKDVPDFLSCLENYIEENLEKDRARLLITDFGPIQDAIFGAKGPGGGGGNGPPSVTTLSGSPVEAVLTAMWITVAQFKKNCTDNDSRPGDLLQKIRITGRKIIERPFEGEEGDASLEKETIEKSIGGIDNFLRTYLHTLDLGMPDFNEENNIEFNLLTSDELARKTNRTATPHLEFSVEIKADGDTTVFQLFRWQMEDTHPARNLWLMAREVSKSLAEKKGTWLPMFHIPHYSELFSAPDEEEIIRILNIGLGNLNISNLLAEETFVEDYAIEPLHDTLSDAFGTFVQCIAEDGYFTAVQTHWPRFFEAYAAILEYLIHHWNSDLASLAYKAFLLVEAPENGASSDPWRPFVSSAVITGLHPALLEMLQERDLFLLDAWKHRVRSFLQDDTGRKMTDRGWRDICDLAEVSNPLFGILTNAEKRLDARITSFGMIHRVGKPEEKGATLMAKVLQRYDAPEDEEIKDIQFFRESRESRALRHLLKAYCDIYPHSQDGLSIAVLNATHIQPMIAGIDEFLRWRFTTERKDEIEGYPTFHLSLAFFVKLSESREVSRWLREWQARWDPSSGSRQLEYYRHCRLQLSQKVVADKKEYDFLIQTENFEADIAILSHFMDMEGEGSDLMEAVRLRRTPAEGAPRKFPVLEMPRCVDYKGAKRQVRGRIISNRHFKLATLHSEITSRLKHPNIHPERRHLVVCEGNFAPWVDIVNHLHRKATWVLCLDPSVDERLIEQDGRDDHSAGKRNIIGFSSGVGAHGELNYTVSTERASLGDIQRKLQKKINEIFGPWDAALQDQAAELFVQEARKLAGLSLVQATGRGEKVRDLIGFGLVGHCLPKNTKEDEQVLCDELVVLDTYFHWFDNIEEQEDVYPDLLRIEAVLDDEDRVRVHATLFECKVSNDVLRHLEKAWSQLNNGLHHLLVRFRPRRMPEEMRFDQRFWWSQLQRLIANKSVVKKADQNRATVALEALGNGDFSISWQAAALTVRTDGGGDQFEVTKNWKFPLPFNEEFGASCDLNIPVISCGGALIARLCNGETPTLPLDSESWCLLNPAEAPEIRTEEEKDPKEIAPAADGSNDVGRPVDEESISAQATEPTATSPVAPEPENEPEDQKEAPAEEPLNPVPTPTPAGDRLRAERIFLGPNDTGREIYWEYGHPELTNRHLLIFGKSGVGKTYAIQALLFEMARAGQNAMIIDYTDGFLSEHMEEPFRTASKPVNHFVVQKPLPINPFRRQKSILDGGIPFEENPFIVGGRVTSVINSVYATIGEQQQALLTETIAESLEKEVEGFDFKMLLEILKAEGKTGMTLANKLSPLVHMRLFEPSDRNAWKDFFEDSQNLVNILQLTKLSKDLQRIATEFILWDLYDYATSCGSKNNPLPIVLDEIQNLDHRLDAPLGKYLTEGRKFGISLILATQTLSNLKADERDRLFQASHKLFFRPAETEVKEYARILEQSGSDKADLWITRLNKLNKGECYSLGPSLNPSTGVMENKAVKIKVAAFEKRRST